VTWQWAERYRSEPRWRWRLRLAWARHQRNHWAWQAGMARHLGDLRAETRAWDRLEAADRRLAILELGP
jgi:hypothetical protein